MSNNNLNYKITLFFLQICKKSTQFQGYEQQDAHELLRCLLDAIRNEEIIRAKKAILKAFALSEKSDPNTVSPKLKKIIKGYGKQATHTIVDQIFGGHMLSTGKDGLIWLFSAVNLKSKAFILNFLVEFLRPYVLMIEYFLLFFSFIIFLKQIFCTSVLALLFVLSFFC